MCSAVDMVDSRLLAFQKGENSKNLTCNNYLEKWDWEVFLYSKKFHFKYTSDIYFNSINSMHAIMYKLKSFLFIPPLPTSK